jgi:integrase
MLGDPMGSIRQRKNGAGKIVFDAEVKHRGFPTRYKTFSRLTDARIWIQDTESTIRSGRYIPSVEAQRHTVAAAIERYIAEELPRKHLRSELDHKRQLEWFKKEIGGRALSEISPAVINELRGKFLRGTNRHGQIRRPQSWNRCLSALSCVFQACAFEWEWLEYNPARRVSREKEARGRTRFLSDDERERLLSACTQSRSVNLYPLVVLTLSTGMRSGEVSRLTWEQVDLNAGVIILTETKNGETRRVPVRGLALRVLKDHAKVRRIGTNFVFPGEKTRRTGRAFELALYWKEAVKAAELKDFRFHDLRHSCASYLAMDGASLLDIAEVLGHKTLQMVKRYSHLTESHVAGVVERMNRKIFGEG